MTKWFPCTHHRKVGNKKGNKNPMSAREKKTIRMREVVREGRPDWNLPVKDSKEVHEPEKDPATDEANCNNGTGVEVEVSCFHDGNWRQTQSRVRSQSGGVRGYHGGNQ